MLRCRACVHSSIAAVCASDATFYCRETSYSGCTASALPCQSASGANSRCSLSPSWYLPSVTNTGVNAPSGQFSFEADRKDRGIGSLPTLLNTSGSVRCYRLRCVWWTRTVGVSLSTAHLSEWGCGVKSCINSLTYLLTCTSVSDVPARQRYTVRHSSSACGSTIPS